VWVFCHKFHKGFRISLSLNSKFFWVAATLHRLNFYDAGIVIGLGLLYANLLMTTGLTGRMKKL